MATPKLEPAPLASVALMTIAMAVVDLQLVHVHAASAGHAAQCTSPRDCTLSGECVAGRCVCDKPWFGPTCASLKLKPAPLAAPFQRKPDNQYTWGAAPFMARDGRPCFYFTWLLAWADGNATRPVPWTNKVAGSLGLACSRSGAPTGPFAIEETLAFPFRQDKYDAAYIENPVLTYSAAHKGWLLAYTSAPANETRNTLNWEGNGYHKGHALAGLEYMGLAFNTDPLNTGTWRRLNQTILAPALDGFEGGVANNPAVIWYDDGRLSVTYRGVHDDGFGNCLMASWTSPCVRPAKNLFNNDTRWISTEDAFTYKGPRGYIMIAHDFANGGGGTKAISDDGVHWEWAGAQAYRYTLTLTNGTSISFKRREEPKLLFSEGRPIALFNVVDDSFNYNQTRIIVQELDYD